MPGSEDSYVSKPLDIKHTVNPCSVVTGTEFSCFHILGWLTYDHVVALFVSD